MSNFHVSPIGVIPKSDGGWRLITHLSYPAGSSINDGIDDELCSVEYTKFDKVADMVFSLEPGALMAKRDIKSAFCLLPIHPGDFHLLGICFQNKFYIDKCLPMGCKISCKLFEEFSTFLNWLVIFISKKKSTDHYLDDFIFCGQAHSNDCKILVSTFENICTDLAIPVAHEKSVGPTTKMVFLGLVIDSDEMTIKIPQQKIDLLLSTLLVLVKQKRVSGRELESLIGMLNFFGKAIRSSRAFLRRFYDRLMGIKKTFYKVRISASLREDMYMWISFLVNHNGITYIPDQKWLDSDTLLLFTDSYGSESLGCGCSFANEWAFFQWPLEWSGAALFSDMTFLEMVPVLLAIMLWGPNLQGKRVLFNIDNQALVSILNKQTSKSSRVMLLLREFVLFCMRYSIVFRAKYICSKSNDIADSLSRKQWSRFRKLVPHANVLPQVIPENFHYIMSNVRQTDC